MALIRTLFFVALFLVSTLCFVTLFEHGTTNFQANFQKEFQSFEHMVHTPVEHKKDDSEKVGTGS